jgi:hypothetical protein
MYDDIILPDMPLSVKPEVVISGHGGALPICVTTPVTGLNARRGTHVHCSTTSLPTHHAAPVAQRATAIPSIPRHRTLPTPA